VIIPSAYAFSRFDFKGKDTILYYYLIVSQAGGGLGVIAVLAIYIFFLRMAAYGIGLIRVEILPFVYVSGLIPFQTWLVKSYFDQLPKELDEASFIDGANWFTLIFRVIFPASKAALIIIILLAFMNAWGEFIIANIMGLQTLGQYIYVKAVAGEAGLMRPGEFAAAAILFAIPMIVLFVLSQKYIGEAYRLGMKG
jgi:arabinogalactan oligomer/maltooligosaccharide transport system permease protein